MDGSTTFLLVRHALTDATGQVLTGRAPAVHLNDAGRLQVRRLAEWLARHVGSTEAAERPAPRNSCGPSGSFGPVAAVFSSPLERARETAAPLAAALGVEVRCAEAINEVDFGEWTGLTLRELAQREDWRVFTQSRGSAVVPGGESLRQVQARFVEFILWLSERHCGHCVVLVSHGDPIRAALVHFLGMPLDFLTRLEIAPGSVSALRISDASPPRLMLLNCCPGSG